MVKWDSDFINIYFEKWKKWKSASLIISDILAYMDRTCSYASSSGRKDKATFIPTLDLCMIAWKKFIFSFFRERLIVGFSNAIDRNDGSASEQDMCSFSCK